MTDKKDPKNIILPANLLEWISRVFLSFCICVNARLLFYFRSVILHLTKGRISSNLVIKSNVKTAFTSVTTEKL